ELPHPRRPADAHRGQGRQDRQGTLLRTVSLPNEPEASEMETTFSVSDASGSLLFSSGKQSGYIDCAWFIDKSQRIAAISSLASALSACILFTTLDHPPSS